VFLVVEYKVDMAKLVSERTQLIKYLLWTYLDHMDS